MAVDRLVLVLALLVAAACWIAPGTAEADDSSAWVYPGDMYVALFLDLHRSSKGSNGTCDEFNPGAVQPLWAAVWAVETLNDQTESEMPKLGLKVYDTCASAAVTTRRTFEFLRRTVADLAGSCDPVPDRFRALGIVGISEPEVLRPVLGLLRVYSVPVILASPSAAGGLPSQSNVLTTAPTMAGTVRAVVALLEELRWKSVRVLSSSAAAVRELRASAVGRDPDLVRSVVVFTDTDDEALDEFAFSREEPETVVVLLLEPQEVDRWVDRVSHRPTTRCVRWVVATPSLDERRSARWSSALRRGFLIAPHPPHLRDFQASFLGALADGGRGPFFAVDEYLREEYRCAGRVANAPSSSFADTLPCSKLTYAQLQRGYRQHPDVPFVSQAVSALSAALRVLQIDGCELGARCVPRHSDGPTFTDVLSGLAKLSFAARIDEPTEVEGTRFRFTEDGKLVFRHFDVYAFEGSSPTTQVGWYSDNVGFHWIPSKRPTSRDARPCRTRTETQRAFPSSSATETDLAPPRTLSSRSSGTVRGWAAAVVVAAGLGLLATTYLFVYFLIKIGDRTLRGNPFLDVALLLGVACLYATSLLFVAPPSEALCHWRLFLHPFGYASCYGVLLLRGMQRRVAFPAGLGDLPGPIHQALTLFFVVGVQVALGIQWSALRRPSFGTPLDAPEADCLATAEDFVGLQSYVALLLLLCCVAAPWAPRVRDDRSEGPRVLLASTLGVPVWVAWVTAFLLAPRGYREPAVCFGLIVNAAVVVGTVFVPKWRALGQQPRSTLANGSPTDVFYVNCELGGLSTSSKSDASSIVDSPLGDVLYFSDARMVRQVPEKK